MLGLSVTSIRKALPAERVTSWFTELKSQAAVTTHNREIKLLYYIENMEKNII